MWICDLLLAVPSAKTFHLKLIFFFHFLIQVLVFVSQKKILEVLKPSTEHNVFSISKKKKKKV
jgi:hypothetical protein